MTHLIKTIATASLTEIGQMIKRLRVIVGQPPADAEELQILSSYVKGNFSRSCIWEIEEAFSWYIKGKLSIQPDSMVKVNASSIERIMTHYRHAKFDQRKAEEESDLTPRQKKEIICQCIEEMFNRHRSGDEVTDYGGAAFRYLTQYGLIGCTNDDKEYYRSIAQRNVSTEAENENFTSMMIRKLRAKDKKNDMVIDDIAGAMVIASFFSMLGSVEDLRQRLERTI